MTDRLGVEDSDGYIRRGESDGYIRRGESGGYIGYIDSRYPRFPQVLYFGSFFIKSINPLE